MAPRFRTIKAHTDAQAMLNLPSNIGVTASLSVTFKAPCQADQVRSPPCPHQPHSHEGVPPALSFTPRRPGLIFPLLNQFVIVRTKLDSVKGRKATVSGTMETLDGEKVAEAR